VAFKITDLHVWFLVLLIDEQRVASIAGLHGHSNIVPLSIFQVRGKDAAVEHNQLSLWN
jgi:hypothetical protein